MLATKAVICLLLASVALADVNKHFAKMLHGEEPLTDNHLNQMYEQFVEQYKDG